MDGDKKPADYGIAPLTGAGTTQPAPSPSPVAQTTPTATTTKHPQAPTAPTESDQWKSFYGSMSSDEQKYFDTLPQEQKNQYAEQIAGGKAQEAQNLLKTYRYTRDVSRQADKMKSDYSAQLEQKKREFGAQAEDAKANVQKVTNNMTLIKGTSGSSRSANLTKAISSEISRSQRNYENLVSAQNDFLKQMEADFKYASDSLSNEFNDNINKKQAAMLEQVNALRKTGELDTALGMQKARSFLDQMLSDQVAGQENYYNRVKALNDTYEVAYKNAQEYSKPSMEMTEMMNQGQKVGTLFNAMGEPIKGMDGQPISYNVQK